MWRVARVRLPRQRPTNASAKQFARCPVPRSVGPGLTVMRESHAAVREIRAVRPTSSMPGVAFRVQTASIPRRYAAVSRLGDRMARPRRTPRPCSRSRAWLANHDHHVRRTPVPATVRRREAAWHTRYRSTSATWSIARPPGEAASASHHQRQGDASWSRPGNADALNLGNNQPGPRTDKSSSMIRPGVEARRVSSFAVVAAAGRGRRPREQHRRSS